MSVGQAIPAALGLRRPPAPRDPVLALQHVLYRAAKADPGRRFHALMDKVYRRDVLQRAWVMVRANNGAPGIDRITLAEVEEYGIACSWRNWLLSFGKAAIVRCPLVGY